MSGARSPTVADHRHRGSGAEAEAEAEVRKRNWGKGFRQGRKVSDGTPERMEGASLRAPETPPPKTPPAHSGDVETSR